MKHIAAKPSHKRRSESEIRTLLKKRVESNVTVKEFCKIYDIHKATFYNWRNIYNPITEKIAEFIPLQIKKPVAVTSVFAEIELAGQIMIRLYQQVDPSYFKALL